MYRIINLLMFLIALILNSDVYGDTHLNNPTDTVQQSLDNSKQSKPLKTLPEDKDREKYLLECTTVCTPTDCKANKDLAKECSKLCQGHGNSVSDWLYKKCSMALAGIETRAMSANNLGQSFIQSSPPSTELMDTQDLYSTNSSQAKTSSISHPGHAQPEDADAANRYELTKPLKSVLTKKRSPQSASSKDIIQSQSHSTREKLTAPTFKDQIGNNATPQTLAEINRGSEIIIENP